MNQVILVSGPAGVGKSAVAQALCERFDRMLHVDVDVLRHFVKAGYRHPWVGDEQAHEQLELAVRNASAIARESVAMRYAVVIDDVIFGWQAALYRQALEGIAAPVHMVTLLPRLEVTLARDAERRFSISERVRALHEQFTREAGAGMLPGAVLDTSDDENAEATADRVQETASLGESLILDPAAEPRTSLPAPAPPLRESGEGAALRP